VRRFLIGATIIALAALALLVAACGGDDGDETPTTAPSTSPPATPAPSPAPSATAELPAITIDIPADAATVDVPFTMGGEADVFEAALTVDALGTDGTPLCERHIMATSGTGTRGTWETVLAFPPPDAATPITVRAYSFSPMDGSIENLVERNITLSSERPAIFITSPGCNDTAVPGATLNVTGRAAVFEAALTVELRDAAGTIVVGQNVMALSGVEEADFSAALAVPPGTPNGFYDLVAFSHSAMDGSVINEFSMQIAIGE